MSDPLPWTYTTSGIPERGISETRAASPDECAEVARVVDIVAVEDLSARYSLKPAGSGKYLLAGSLDARVVQACVVSLEPIPAVIAETFEIELCPAEKLAEATLVTPDEDMEILSTPDVAPFEDGVIRVGDLIFEVLAAALPPYPRKDDVTFDWVDPKTQAAPEVANPFAVLAKLKPKD